MWRDVSGKLVIRFNGEMDCGDTDNMQIVPNLYFVSDDDGKSWSNSYSIIGKTLKEYRQDGVSDADSKYFDTCSYSNVFVEKIQNNTILVLYTNLKYDEGDGKNHKAAFVRTVTFLD